MRNTKHYILILASVLLIACEQEDFSLGHNSVSSCSTNVTLVAQPPTDEDVISLDLATFGTETFPHGPTDSDTLIHVTSFPVPCTLWQGHVVALVEPVPIPATPSQTTEFCFTLLSKSEWSDLPSALNATNPDAALAIPPTYTEGTLKDWRIPTAAEAKAFRDAYSMSSASNHLPGSPTFESLNDLLASITAPTIQAIDEKGNSVRYLCEGATRSFSFAPGTTISAAGTKSTTYRLRLVKTLHLKLKQ